LLKGKNRFERIRNKYILLAGCIRRLFLWDTCNCRWRCTGWLKSRNKTINKC